MNRYRGRFPDGDVTVLIDFYIHGRSRIDGDNCEKLVADALQDAGVIGNDDQVFDCHWRIHRVASKDDQRTVVRVATAEDTGPLVQ